MTFSRNCHTLSSGYLIGSDPGVFPNNGKECIQLYKDFLKKRDAITAEEILGHNLEDVLGLGRIFEMLSYLCIYDSEYEVTYAELDDENLILELTLPYQLPQKFSNGNEQFVSASKHGVVQNSRIPAIMPTSLFEALFSIPS